MSLWNKFKQGLKKTATQLQHNIGTFAGKKIDDTLLENLEDALIMADCGPDIAQEFVEKVATQKPKLEEDGLGLHRFLAQEITILLKKNEKKIITNFPKTPHVMLIIGVNGSGKTTSIAKFAHFYKQQGKKILLGAGDTFRAAAIEQLSVWASRLDIAMIKTHHQGDAASLCFDALDKAIKEDYDLLLFDTAGRLHTNKNLMGELEKISKVMKKFDRVFPQETILVLDATSGQNILNQIKIFQETIPISGIILTKLDGTAKGGILLQIASLYPYPIYAIGTGEKIEDLQDFDAHKFAHAILGLSLEND